jgi:hypothetical protein
MKILNLDNEGIEMLSAQKENNNHHEYPLRSFGWSGYWSNWNVLTSHLQYVCIASHWALVKPMS